MDDGRFTPADDVDHIVPLYKGGTYDRGNLQPLCKAHHAAKTAQDVQRNPERGCDEHGNPMAAGSHWHA
jgi:5-methylcytosine-specific restriction enzyme A